MLLTICPRIGPAAPRLSALCGNHPLALAISASMLADAPFLSVEAYLDALEDARAHLAHSPAADSPALEVRAVLTTSYEALAPDVQTIFCQLSVFQASFDAAAATTVVARSKRTRKRTARLLEKKVLDLLCRRKLLQGDPLTGRYCMPEPVRWFAANHLEPGHGREVALRYALYYLDVAHQAAAWYRHPEGAMVQQGEQLFAAERPHIEAGWKWAIQQPPHRVTDTLIVGYSLATAPVSGRWYDARHERVPQLQAAIQSSIRLGWQKRAHAFRDELGKLYTELGELQLAIACYTPPPKPRHRTIHRRAGGLSRGVSPRPPGFAQAIPQLSSGAPSHISRLLAWVVLALVGGAGVVSFAGYIHLELIIQAGVLLGLYGYAVSGHFDAGRRLAIALTLVPLVRIISIGTLLLPLEGWQQWGPSLFSMPFLFRDAIGAFLLFIAVNMALWNLGIPRRELGILLERPLIYTALLMMGTGLGIAGYHILITSQGSLDPATLSDTVPWHAPRLFLALLPAFTGATLELIFRGAIQTTAPPVLGRWSFLYGAALFATIYAQHHSLQFVAIAFLLGLFLAYLVDWSRSLLGAMAFHSLLAIIVFFAAPSLEQSVAGELTNSSPAMLEQGDQWGPVLSFIQVLTLLVLLIQQEVFNGVRSIRSQRISQALNIALYPLFLLFLAFILVHLATNYAS